MITPVVDRLDVYRRHADELTRYATSLVGPADAPDIVTDAVLAAVQSPSWDQVHNQRAYLYRAVLSRARSVRRSDDRRRVREQRVAVPVDASDPEPSTDAHAALATLSPQQRAIVHLTYWEDLSPATIAALLDIGEGSVKKQLARARDQLRRVLG